MIFERLVFLIALGALLGALTAILAESKRRNPLRWFVLGFVFPLPAIFVLALLPSMDQTKTCPHCAEPVRRAAIKCKHCGSDTEPILNLG